MLIKELGFKATIHEPCLYYKYDDNGGIIMMLAGAVIYYRTRLQPTIAQSSTKAEFTNMADAGKAALYLKWILEELGIIMLSATSIHADNQGAIRLANSQQPTRRTRHVRMKHFVILQWTDDNT